jgi:hypothetical protein
VAVNQVGGGTNGWGVTQSDGTYQVGGGFPTGTYTVKFYAGANCPSNPGNYDFQYYGNQPTVTTTQPVSVTNGVTTTGIDAAMVTGGSIAGTVRAAASGTGLQTICVNSIGSGVPGNSYSTTDINGNFTIDALNTGTYAILFGSYSGFTCGSASYQYQWYNQKLGQGTATPVSVMVGQTTSGIDASLTAKPITSTTAIGVSPALVGQGQNVTDSATVTGAGGTPTGAVVFVDGSQTLCTATLTSGSGTCVTNSAPAGVDAIAGTYSGDALFTPSIGTSAVTVEPPVPPSQPRHGYCLVGGDGGICTFGAAHFYGSTGSLRLQCPVVGIVPSNDRGGHLMVGADGGVFALGDPHFSGSCPGIGGCNGAAVAVVPDASGNGHWSVTTSGRVYAFGDALNYGSPGARGTVTPAARTPDGRGYRVLVSNGSVSTFGDAPNLGGLAAGSTGASNPADAIFSTADGNGYRIGTADVSVYPHGNAPNDGSMTRKHLNAPIIAAVGW